MYIVRTFQEKFKSRESQPWLWPISRTAAQRQDKSGAPHSSKQGRSTSLSSSVWSKHGKTLHPLMVSFWRLTFTITCSCASYVLWGTHRYVWGAIYRVHGWVRFATLSCAVRISNCLSLPPMWNINEDRMPSNQNQSWSVLIVLMMPVGLWGTCFQFRL